MSFTDVLKKAFPFISAAASLGGPIGTMAANLVGKALGADKPPEPTLDGISTAMAAAFADPAQRTALIQAEQQFQAQMAELGYKDAEELAATDAQDRANARAREVSVRDYTPEVGFYLLTITFGFFLHWLFKYPVPADNKAIVYSAMGGLSTLVIMAATYFYGTTRGSEKKTDILAQTNGAQANGKK